MQSVTAVYALLVSAHPRTSLLLHKLGSLKSIVSPTYMYRVTHRDPIAYETHYALVLYGLFRPAEYIDGDDEVRSPWVIRHRFRQEIRVLKATLSCG